MGRLEEWAEYVARHIGERNQHQVAELTGVSQPTISRWMKAKAAPSLESAVLFARACGANPIEALVVLGAIRGEDLAGVDVIEVRTSLQGISDAELVAELRRRLDASDDAKAPASL